MSQTLAQLVKGANFTSAPDGAITVDSSGRFLVGTSSSSANARIVAQGNSDNAASSAEFYLQRGEATPADGAGLGTILFADSGAGVGAQIASRRDGGTWSSTSKPSRLVFSTTADGASSPTERMRIANDGSISSVIPGGSTLYPRFGCRAWIAHNSSTLQGSGNISSLTRNGVGDYTVNFSTAMPDTNYAPVYMGEAGRIITKNAGSFNYARILDNGTATDGPVGIAIFR